MLGYPPSPPPPPPGEPGGRPPDSPTPKVWVNQGGGGTPPPLQPPKLSHTPRGHTLAGGGPRALYAGRWGSRIWIVSTEIDAESKAEMV